MHGRQEDEKDRNNGGGREDAYRRVDYRRFIAWPQRIQREAPFLEQILGGAPERSLLDLGCGTGEHSRYFASQGYRVIGIDSSEAMLEKAREEPVPENLSFVHADLREVSKVVPVPFGGAISLGNTLVHLTSEEALSEALSSIREALLPGGVFLFQILNYQRIFERNIRYLPLNFRKGGGVERIFLRVMDFDESGMVEFCPTTLSFDPRRDPPLQVEESRLVRLRGWRHRELAKLLAEAGFEEGSYYGDMTEGGFDPSESNDLVVVAFR